MPHGADAEAFIKSILDTEFDHCFDLAQGPLFNCGLIELSPSDFVLFWNTHHIVLDRAGQEVFAKLLEQAYRKQSARGLPSWPDYVAAEAAYRGHAAHTADSIWWDAELEDLPSPATLARDGQDSLNLRRPGAVSCCLDRMAFDRLARMGRYHGGSRYAAFATAIYAYLARLTGQFGLAFGMANSGRSAGTRMLAGMVASILPLRVESGPDVTISGLIAQIGRKTRDIAAHRRYPLGDIVADRRQRGLAEPFSVIVNLQSFHQTLDLGTASGVIESAGSGPVQDLSLQIFDRRDAGPVELRLEFDAQRYTRAEAQRHLSRLSDLMCALPDLADVTVASLPLFDAQEHARLIADSAGPVVEVRSTHLVRLLDAQAALCPNDTALIFENEPTSYAELNAASNRLARALIAHGIGPDRIVAILLERSPAAIVAMLAILKAGGAYLPLDADLPAARLAYMAQDSQADLVLTTRALLAGCPLGGRAVLLLDDPQTEAAIARHPSSPIADDERRGTLLPAHLAYLIYTSGSTGRPKACGNTHDALVNRLDWMQHGLCLSASDRVAQKTPIGFDVSVWEWLLPLLTGATLVICRSGGHKDPSYLRDIVDRHGVTVMHFVPSMLALFVAGLDGQSCRSLRQIVTSGEALGGALQRQTLDRLPLVRLWNLYGPTEAAIDVSFWLCRTQDGDSTPPIGHPIWNTQILLLDSTLQPVPDGVIGELYLAGRGLARGYLGRPGLTAERFIANPHAAPGTRMYRTGDLGWRRPDGAVMYVGRTDDQIKIRGQRVELGEIANAILSRCAQDVADAAVIARKVGDDLRLFAYLVPRPGRVLPAAEGLRAVLARDLPDHMLPASFTALDALPLSANGKLDRRALPEPVTSNGGSARPPATPHEALLCRVFAEVIQADGPGDMRVGPDDNFFAIGGHSLLALRLIARLREISGGMMPLALLFAHPTPAALASHFAALQPDLAPDLQAGGGRLEGGRVVLSFGQQRLWMLQRVEDNASAYTMPGAWRITGALDIAALRSALTGLVTRHAALRTAIIEGPDGTPEGHLLAVPPAAALLSVTDATEQDIHRHIAAEAERPFRLGRDLSLRASLLRLAPGDAVLTLTLHHQAGDGVSLGVLARDLAQAYGGGALAPLAVQYSDWAAWQQASLAESLPAKIARARDRLRGMPDSLTLPLDHPRLADRARRAGVHELVLPPPLVMCLDALARAAGTTLFTVVLAAFGATLSRLAGQQDVVIGSPVAGRGRIETDGLIGFFVNTLALPVSLGGAITGQDLIARARASVEAALIDQDLPFERLVEELGVARSLAHTPVFQAMLAFQTQGEAALTLPGLTVTPLPVRLPRAKFDLNLTLTPTRAGTIEGSLEYDRDLFDARGVAAWASAFITLTTALAADPGAPITALPLLDADARAAALAAAAGPAVDLPAGRLTVPALFDAQVARDPHAIALIAGSQHLSYGDLDAAANRLARTLIARGVGPDDIVAILLDRSADLVIALLAILKAGAAYLPLDPQYPAERRGFMLRDSQARLLVTTTALRGDTPAPAAICLDDAADPGCGTRITDRDRRAPLLPGHLAYLIYTSGSTGTPKGVAVTHLSLAHQLLWMQSRHPSGAGRTMLGRTSIAFDASVWEIFSPLICGSRIVLVDSATLSDTARLAQTLAAHAVTDIQLVPSLIAPLAPALAGSPIRLVFAGGAILPRAEIERLSADCTASVINLYGPTEATVQVAHWQADHAPRPSASPHAPVGAPIWNTRIHILDASLEPLPAGVVGELYIAGIALARGYAGRPGLTAERFIACPFGPPGARMYRTGDLGRLDPDGQILLLGRADDQIKIRGFRVEPGEIEAAILALFPGQVTAADRRTGSAHRLIAYLVPPPGGSVPDAAAIRDALAARLPEYMIPSAFVPLAALPRLANGKLDRRALPDVAAADTGRIHRTPRTAREALLCRLFGELTGTGNVGPEDGFFSIGGDSISAIRLVSLARAAGLSLTVRDVFRHQTPGALRVRRTDCC